MKRLIFIALALAATACSDSTGPKDANVAGSWTYNATNLAGGGLSCSISGVTVTISQSGSTFTGSYSTGSLSCGSVGGANFAGGTVVSGTVSNNAVTFNFDTQDWTHAGSVSGSSIAGTTSVRLILTGGQTLIMNGNFSMVKR